MDKCLVFEISSEFGYFKRYNSTTSPTTHNVIPKTTLIGLISAIIGKFEDNDKRDIYLNYFNNDNCKIAIEVLSPIKRTFFGVNYTNLKEIRPITKDILKKISEKINGNIDNEIFLVEDFHKLAGSYDKKGAPYTQVNMEVVKKPHYRIYLAHSNKVIYDLLKDRLLNSEVYYPPFMGTTDFPCIISNVSEQELNKIDTLQKEVVKIHSVVPNKSGEVTTAFKQSSDRCITRQSEITLEKQPYLFIKEDNGYRRNVDFIEINISSNCQPIYCETNTYYKSGDRNLLFY